MTGSWPGLDRKTLAELELDWCAHRHHADWKSLFSEAPINKPFGRCSFLLHRVWQRCKMDAARAGANVPPLKELAPLINQNSTSGISQLLNAQANWRLHDPATWHRCAKLLRYLLLGLSAPDGPSDSRTALANRILEFFFEASDDHLSTFFTRTLDSGTFQRPLEGAYDLLGLFLDNSSGSFILAVSGSARFLQVADGRITPIGEATIAVAAQGTRVQFIYPDPTVVGKTPAHKSLDEFFEHCLVEDKASLTESMLPVSPLSQMEYETAKRSITRSPCDPQILFSPSRASRAVSLPEQILKKIPACYYLNPICKFLYYEFGVHGQSRLHISREGGDHSFAFEATARELARFQVWSHTVPAKLKQESIADFERSKTKQV